MTVYAATKVYLTMIECNVLTGQWHTVLVTLLLMVISCNEGLLCSDGIAFSVRVPCSEWSDE